MIAKGNWVLVLNRKDNFSQGGIFLPSSNSDDFFTGEILSVGNEVEDESLRKGDEVIVARIGRWQVGKIKGTDVFAVSYGDIICKVDDEE